MGWFIPQSRSFQKNKKILFLIKKKNNGIIGLDHDPFKFKRKNFYKPTGVEEDSFTTKHRKMAYSNKYDKESLKKKAIKSRNKYIKKKWNNNKVFLESWILC